MDPKEGALEPGSGPHHLRDRVHHQSLTTRKPTGLETKQTRSHDRNPCIRFYVLWDWRYDEVSDQSACRVGADHRTMRCVPRSKTALGAVGPCKMNEEIALRSECRRLF